MWYITQVVFKAHVVMYHHSHIHTSQISICLLKNGFLNNFYWHSPPALFVKLTYFAYANVHVVLWRPARLLSTDGCPNSCNRHGKCQLFLDGWRCSCSDGWKGVACTVAIETRCDNREDDDGGETVRTSVSSDISTAVWVKPPEMEIRGGGRRYVDRSLRDKSILLC